MKLRSCVILIMLISIWGCSTANDNSITLDASGKHPAGWAVASNGGNHPATYLSAPDRCKECHGTDLKGGISTVSCFSTDRNGTSCHPQGPSGHPAGWSDPASHGARAKAAASGVNGMAFCANCHGADYRGAGTRQKDCLRCHTTAPHPAKPWTGTRSHTSADPGNAPACAKCHAGKTNLSPEGVAKLPATATIGSGGCFDTTLCHGVMGHSSDPQPWNLPANHGSRAKADPGGGGNTGLAACRQCHGASFATVLGTNSCVGCHGVAAPHPAAANWRSTGTVTHTTTGLNNASVCALCHNSSSPVLAAPNLERFANSPAGSFNGGSPDCFTASMCHGDVRKTSNCDACHSIATTNPFKSIAGATAASDSKVGAHVKHLSASVQTPPYSVNIACSECHAVPNSPAVSGTHRNGSNDIAFGTLAKTGSLTPVYTAVTGVCANTYCHGTALSGGTNKSPVWNQPGYLTAAGCGTCHGFPPATFRNGATHSGSTGCSGCHFHVNASSNGFTTAGVALHINGSVEASGGHGGAPYPGSSHRGVSTSGCFDCHPANAAGSSYPASAGTPPNCRACHLSADPSTDPHCSDCHGDAASGRPNLTSTLPADFPKRQGQHLNGTGKHSNFACTVCHPFTSGDSRHGWSNRQKSTSAQINTTIGWNATAKTCSNSCHGSEQWY